MIELKLLLKTHVSYEHVSLSEPEQYIKGDILSLCVEACQALVSGVVCGFDLVHRETGYRYSYDFKTTYPFGDEDFRLAIRIPLQDRDGKELFG